MSDFPVVDEAEAGVENRRELAQLINLLPLLLVRLLQLISESKGTISERERERERERVDN